MQRTAACSKFVQGELLISETTFQQHNDVSPNEESEDDHEEGSGEDGVDDDADEGHESSTNSHKVQPQPPVQSAGKKRMRSRFLMCEQCEEFDATENNPSTCRYHPGKYEILFLTSSYLNNNSSRRA